MRNKDVINTPILIIGFNRPDISRQTVAKLAESQPTKLYVAIDAARDGRPGETKLVEEVKQVYTNIPWECQVSHRFNEKNMGAEITVSEAVSWVLSQEESVIVLEDDILAPYAFLKFAQDMLIRYKNDEHVYMVSGSQFTPMDNHKADYHFSYFGHTGCGWATNRRAWNHFSLYVNDFDDYLGKSDLKKEFGDKHIANYVKHFIGKMKKVGAGNSSWDRCWEYVRIKNQGYAIVPSVNLTRNIGFYGLHGHGEQDFQRLPFDESFEAKHHPEFVQLDYEYDRHHYKSYLYQSFLQKVRNKLGYEYRKRFKR